MKKTIALLLAVLMILSMVACAANTPAKTEEPATTQTETTTPDTTETEEPAATEEPATEEHEPATLEVFLAQVDWADAWDELEARFEEQHPWISIEHVGLGADADFLQQRLAANDLPDAIQLNNGVMMNAMVEQNLLTDLTNWECAKLMPKAYADAYTFDGKLVGMCQGAAFSTMFYNMDILNEAGWDTVPTCWDELIQCCKDIKEKTGVAPLVTAAGKHTTCWMIYELILANVAGEELGNYEDDFKNGTFDFTKYPEATARLQEIAPYFLEGTASALEEDAATYMSDGLAAMCLAGNWNGGMILGSLENGAASLPPFGAAGELPYISTSPEDAFCVTENPDRTSAEQEALEIFFNWLFEGENFQLIQNARGTVPVITSMTEDQIVLPDAMIPVAAEMGSAPFVLMGFNLYSAEFKDAVMAKIQGVLTGDNTAEDAVATMWSIEQASPLNK